MYTFTHQLIRGRNFCFSEQNPTENRRCRWTIRWRQVSLTDAMETGDDLGTRAGALLWQTEKSLDSICLLEDAMQNVNVQKIC